MSGLLAEGSLVRLKSGGPRMTVTSIVTGPDGESIVHARWFSGAGTLEAAAFPASALERIGESGSGPHAAD